MSRERTRPRPVPAPADAPPLRLPHLELPTYRFVPGLNPHPFRHPQGHLYTDGSPPVEAPWDPETPWQKDTGWLRGLDLFDHRYFWEAHETWEAVWHQVPRDDPYRDLLQGMIQVAAALLKHHLGHDKAAKRLLQRGTARLERVQLAGQHHCRGLSLERSMASWEAFLSDGPWPEPLVP